MPPRSESIDIEDEDELDTQIAEQVNEWSTNSNECFTLKLVRSDGSVAAEFQPEFTYPMFGDEEAIFGYQGLEITLTFAAHDLAPRLDITYDKIFEPQGDVRPTDIREALKDFLPAPAFHKDQTLSSAPSFQPPGEKIREYKRQGKSYEIWCSSLVDPAAKEILVNMQILIPMFIEGGTSLELEQDWTTSRWKLFLVYEVDHSAKVSVSPYALAGFATSYRVFSFPDRQTLDLGGVDFFSPTSQTIEAYLSNPGSQQNVLAHPDDVQSPLDLPSRERLSQFLIFPPNQGAGHGQALYNTLYHHLSSPANVREFTVEDPNEKFDDLRDFCDLLHLRAHVPEFAALRINTDIPADRLASSGPIPTDLIVSLSARERIMAATKIMPRQFDRLVEMHTLSFIPASYRSRNRITRKEKASNEFDRAYFFWRLYGKQRLYIFNRDQLAQVEGGERVDKLDAALDSVLEAYSTMIEKVEAKEREMAESGGPDDSPARTTLATKRKRPVVQDDDDEDEVAGAESATVHPQPNGNHKKSRMTDAT